MTTSVAPHEDQVSRESRRRAIAWLLFAATLLIMGLGVFSSLEYASAINALPDEEAIEAGFYLALLVFAVPGLFLSIRKPTHPIGWLLAGVAITWSSLGAAASYTTAAVRTPHGPLAGAEWTALVSSFAWVFGFLWLGMTVFLFPTGSPPTTRWRWVIPLGALATGLLVSGIIFHPMLDPTLDIDNPLGWQGATGLLDATATLGLLLLYLFLGSVFAAFVVRIRTSRGIERQQLKFLAFSVVVAVSIGALLTARDTFELGPNSGLVFEALQIVGLLAAAFVPVAIVIAIMRYGLYDLGRIVNRTIVYALVIPILGGVYALGVFTTARLLPIGGSNLGIAASTLAVAALFNPVRRRVQGFINAKLFRTAYHPGELLEQFQEEMRNVVDAEEVGVRFVNVVSTVFRPEKVGVWIRDREPT